MSPSRVSVLAVSSSLTDIESLRRIFSSSNWRLDHVCNVADAAHHVARYGTPVLLCADRLPDGTWEDVLKSVGGINPDALIIVISRAADDAMWQGVLTNGGYDVLPIPLGAVEVFRVVALAWRKWRDTVSRRIGAGEMAAHA